MRPTNHHMDLRKLSWRCGWGNLCADCDRQLQTSTKHHGIDIPESSEIVCTRLACFDTEHLSHALYFGQLFHPSFQRRILSTSQLLPPSSASLQSVGDIAHIHRRTTLLRRFLPAADKLVLSAVVQLPAASRWLVESLLSSSLVSKTDILAVSGSS